MNWLSLQPQRQQPGYLNHREDEENFSSSESDCSSAADVVVLSEIKPNNSSSLTNNMNSHARVPLGTLSGSSNVNHAEEALRRLNPGSSKRLSPPKAKVAKQLSPIKKLRLRKSWSQ